MKQFFSLILLIPLLACGGSNKSLNEREHNKGILEINYGPCFGTCPVYKVSLTADGLLTYEGKRFVAVLGVHQRRVNADVFERALAYIEATPVLTDPKPCPRRYTDSKTVRGSLKTDKLDVSIHHYYGCSGYPGRKEQTKLITRLTELLAVQDLVRVGKK